MQHRPLTIAAAIAFLGQGSLALASDNSATVFPAEGNKQCSDYAANSTILQMGTNSLQAAGTLTGAENPRDPDSTGETVSYQVANGTAVSFSASTTPIDYAILKSGRSISVIIYPSGGVTQDANMVLNVGGQDQPITGVSLCYGLGNAAPPPPPVSEIPRCEDLNMGEIDNVGIACPASGTRSLIFNFELDEAFYNTQDTPIACVCNSTAGLSECDPSVPAGEPNACPDPNAPGKRATEVSTLIELNNDPYVCTYVAGVPKCYRY